MQVVSFGYSHGDCTQIIWLPRPLLCLLQGYESIGSGLISFKKARFRTHPPKPQKRPPVRGPVAVPPAPPNPNDQSLHPLVVGGKEYMYHELFQVSNADATYSVYTTSTTTTLDIAVR